MLFDDEAGLVRVVAAVVLEIDGSPRILTEVPAVLDHADAKGTRDAGA